MNSEQPTIAALLTPLAPGAIAVIGLAGPRTQVILGALVRRKGHRSPPILVDRQPVLCTIIDGDIVVDDAIVVRKCVGGEDGAEVNTHGGVRIVQRVLLILERLGAQIVDGHHFKETRSAAHPIQQWVDRALISSKSRRLTRWLLRQRRDLPKCVDSLSSQSERDRKAFVDRSRVATRVVSGMTVALIGPPNSGKSTLANRMAGRPHAITSDQPGTTRDWVAPTVLVEGWPVAMTDTAGLRSTECDIEAEAIRRSEALAYRADASIIVLDATLPPETRARQLADIQAALPADGDSLLVLNKCDLLSGEDRSSTTRSECLISARTGEGLSALERHLASLLGLDLLEGDLPAAFRSEMLEQLD